MGLVFQPPHILPKLREIPSPSQKPRENVLCAPRLGFWICPRLLSDCPRSQIMSPVFLKARHLWSPWPPMHPSYTRDFKDAVEISILLKGKKGIVLRGSFPTPQAPLPRLCRDPTPYQLGGSRTTPRSYTCVFLSIMCSLWN